MRRCLVHLRMLAFLPSPTPTPPHSLLLLQCVAVVLSFFLQFLDLTPGLFIPFGQLARICSALRQLVLQALQFLGHLLPLFVAREQLVSPLLMPSSMFSHSHLLRYLDLSHLQLFTTVCLLTYLHLAIFLRLCVIIWFLKKCTADFSCWLSIFLTFLAMLTTVSFASWALYASIWSSPSHDEDDADQLRFFLGLQNASLQTCQDIALLTTHWSPNKIDKTILSDPQ